MDSAVTLAVARSRGFALHALTVQYGQRNEREIAAAKKVAEHLGAVEHRLIEVDLAGFGGSALTGPGEIPKGGEQGTRQEIPSTYVPARNTVLLSLALAWAEALGSRDIFIGVSAVDFSGYPDCRPDFIEQFQRLAALGTRAVLGGAPFEVHAPLIGLSKAETVLLGEELGVDFSLTSSCYSPTAQGQPCGECDSCVLRAKGFAQSGRPDPGMES
jgi:7-cyano-7-deazaguanine synthase